MRMVLKERKENAGSREKNLKFNRISSIVRNLEKATLDWAREERLEGQAVNKCL